MLLPHLQQRRPKQSSRVSSAQISRRSLLARRGFVNGQSIVYRRTNDDPLTVYM